MSETNDGLFSCRGICWIAGALLGIAAFLILRGRWDMGFVWALIIGLIVLIAVAMLLRSMFCNEYVDTRDHSITSKPAAAPETAAAASRAAAPAAKPAEPAKPEARAPAVKPAPAKKPAAKKPAAKATGGSKTADKATKSATTKTAAATKKPARKPVAKDGKPETLSKPRGGKGDDLKLIKGVGPQLEKTLNELGFWHYDQIAGWRNKEAEWVDTRLKFKGRIERDGWIAQAKTLARGGTTEFAKRAAKTKKYDK